MRITRVGGQTSFFHLCRTDSIHKLGRSNRFDCVELLGNFCLKYFDLVPHVSLISSAAIASQVAQEQIRSLSWRLLLECAWTNKSCDWINFASGAVHTWYTFLVESNLDSSGINQRLYPLPDCMEYPHLHKKLWPDNNMLNKILLWW